MSVRQKSVRSEENIAGARESVRDDSNLSVLQQSQELDIPNSYWASEKLENYSFHKKMKLTSALTVL